jgi:predicted ATP-grasp superfamily ATP-dependent carboligase
MQSNHQPQNCRVLLTYGWCRTAYVAAESLAKVGFEVYACSESPWSMTRVSRFVRRFDQVPDPFREPESYVAALAALVQKYQIDLLLPVHEDCLAIQTYRHLLPKTLTIASPSRSDLLIALDKYEIIKIAELAQVGIPRTIVPLDFDHLSQLSQSLSFPLILKTRRGNSGKGVFRIQDSADLVPKYREVVESFRLSVHQLPILQEFMTGDGYGSCFLAEKGKLHGCFVERYLRCKEKGFGTSVLREPYHWPLLEEYTSRLVAEMNWTGIGHFDFIGTPELNQAYLIEMNPRFWGALNLAVQNGYDFPRAWITMLTDGKPDLDCLQPSSQPTRSLWIVGEMIAGVGELKEGHLGALLNSLRRIVFPGLRSTYDDFRWHDPLPLGMEMLYYGNAFLAAGGSLNPVTAEMMQ